MMALGFKSEGLFDDSDPSPEFLCTEELGDREYVELFPAAEGIVCKFLRVGVARVDELRLIERTFVLDGFFSFGVSSGAK